jgi:hypothetical protein
MNTSATWAGSFKPARFNASVTTIAPNFGAGKLLRLPWNLPEGVRQPLKITGILFGFVIYHLPDSCCGLSENGSLQDGNKVYKQVIVKDRFDENFS